MSEFKVTIAALNGASQGEAAIARDVARLGNQMEGILGRLSLDSAAAPQIRNTLRALIKNLSSEDESLRQLSDALSEVAGLYESTEDGLKMRAPVITAGDLFESFPQFHSPTGFPDPRPYPSISDLLEEWFSHPHVGHPHGIPSLWDVLQFFVSPFLLAAGVPETDASFQSYGDWFGAEVDTGSDHAGVSGYIGKGHAQFEDGDSSFEVNGSIGKAEGELKWEAGYSDTFKGKQKDGEWTEKEAENYWGAEASAKASVSALSGDASLKTGDDMFGAKEKFEGSIGNATAEGKAEVGLDEDGFDAVVSGKAMASAAEGKASASFDFLGLEVTVKGSAYAGAAGVEGKAGFEDGKFVLEGGAAAGVGASLGIEVGLNEGGRQALEDLVQSVRDLFGRT